MKGQVYMHALEAACCMGEMWAMRAELEDEGVYMTCIRSCLLYG